MRSKKAPFIAVALIAGSFSQASAANDKSCKTVTGVMQETIIPASQTTDPFGRIIGMFDGDFAGASIAAVTAFLVTPPAFSNPAPGPSSVMQVRHVFLTGPGDTVITLGKTIFTPAPATQPGQSNFVASTCPFAPCVVENPQVLDVIGGTGRWAGATGQLQNLGIGNLDLPNGKGEFVFQVKGEICVGGKK
ncbi:MAG: hypothetical protein JWN34_4777 [Bryobacterales bacterium]|jgi:hypothetical protein|nr:hypothetical protein [Bryobacterales bacterium]